LIGKTEDVFRFTAWAGIVVLGLAVAFSRFVEVVEDMCLSGAGFLEPLDFLVAG
jgi:hypothetical protein